MRHRRRCWSAWRRRYGRCRRPCRCAKRARPGASWSCACPCHHFPPLAVHSLCERNLGQRRTASVSVLSASRCMGSAPWRGRDRGTCSGSTRRLKGEWSGIIRSKPGRAMMEPISPSVWRKARWNTDDRVAEHRPERQRRSNQQARVARLTAPRDPRLGRLDCERVLGEPCPAGCHAGAMPRRRRPSSWPSAALLRDAVAMVGGDEQRWP